MPTTGRGFFYPATTDDPNVPGDMQTLAESLQTELDSALTLGASLTVPTDLIIGAAQIKLNPLLVIKPSVESVSSSVTMQSDDHLVLPLAASHKYLVAFGLSTDGAVGNDIRIAFTIPSGMTGLINALGPHFQATDGTLTTSLVYETFGDADFQPFGTIAAFDHRSIVLFGVVQTAGSAGNLQLRWCQNSSGATATRILGGSWAFGLMVG
jgi:hypothetical protein